MLPERRADGYAGFVNVRNVGPAGLAVAALLVLVGTLVGGGPGTAMLAFGGPGVPAALAILAAGGRRRAIGTIVVLAVGCQAILLLIAFGGWPPATIVAAMP